MVPSCNKSSAGGPKARQKRKAKGFPGTSRLVAGTRLASLLSPQPCLLLLQPSLLSPQHGCSGRGACLQLSAPTTCGDGNLTLPRLTSGPAFLVVLSSSHRELFPSLLLLSSVKMSSAQFVIFFQRNASLRHWHGVTSRRGHRPRQGMFGGARWCSMLLEVKTQQTHPPQPAYSIVFPGILRRRKAS